MKRRGWGEAYIPDMTDKRISRRGLMGGALAAMALAAWASTRDQAKRAVTVIQTKLPKAAKPLPPLPADPAASVAGLSTLITPNASFYRIDISGEIPMPSLDAWTLTIDGLVDRPMTLTYDDLISREIVEIDATISCVSNWVGGSLVGNARWTGVRLDDLLAEAGIKPSADQVMGHSVDDFTAGFPTEVLDGRDAIVAIGMNGAPLPAEHGFPARIIVPGLYGYVSAVKWLSRIELTRFDEQVGYWVPRGWASRAPMKIASRIDSPKDDASIKAGAKQISGVAWSANVGISTVEVQVDAGPWLPATLGPALARSTWRQWWLPWEAEVGTHTISVRVTDGEGQHQSTTPVDSMPNGAEGLHSIQVVVV